MMQLFLAYGGIEKDRVGPDGLSRPDGVENVYRLVMAKDANDAHTKFRNQTRG